MRCIPALFLLFTLVAATIFAMSAEVGRPPAAPGETCSAGGLPPAACGVESRSMSSGSGRGGGGEAAGARKSAAVAAAAGEREGRKELKVLARKMDRLVWAAFGSRPKPSFLQAGHGFWVRPSIFFLPFPSFEGADLRHFLARAHN
jgi:hypothetical protein